MSLQGTKTKKNFVLFFQLFDMFVFILERPHIQSQIGLKYKDLVDMFSSELDIAKLVFDAQMSAAAVHKGIPPISKNMPHVAGQLKWAQELRDRIQTPMTSFKAISHPYVYCRTLAHYLPIIYKF